MNCPRIRKPTTNQFHDYIATSFHGGNAQAGMDYFLLRSLSALEASRYEKMLLRRQNK